VFTHPDGMICRSDCPLDILFSHSSLLSDDWLLDPHCTILSKFASSAQHGEAQLCSRINKKLFYKVIIDIINTKLTAKEAFNNYAIDALENNDMVPLYVHYFTP